MTATNNAPPQHICVTAAQQLVIGRADPADLTWSLHISDDTLRRLKEGAPGATWHQALLWRMVAYERSRLGTDTIAAEMRAQLDAVPAGQAGQAVHDLSKALPHVLATALTTSEALQDGTVNPDERRRLLESIPITIAALERALRDLKAAGAP